MPANDEVAAQFEEIADRLLLEGESWFKIAAYRRAANTLRGLAEPVTAVAERSELDSLPGVGDAITTKIESFLSSGHIPLLDRLRSEQPPGLLPLMRETGLNPRDVLTLATSPLQIDSPEALQQAVENGSLEQSGLLTAKERSRLTGIRPREGAAPLQSERIDTPRSQSSKSASRRPQR
jgi:DNA polymerase (family X)